ncbi:RNA-directed DNA polymerase, eukaryota [Tanacetum coccineum]|uniref:RNA-directed DNA polymerase, eukaryota n=1 Tax=Tanacetum coccineum TaxID=301880 RepID=A0ABQ5I7L0_9ASTR
MESLRRNFFNGIKRSEKKMVWIRWEKLLASKKNEGLGQSLWSSFFIKAIHGDKGAIDNPNYSSRTSIWLDLIREFLLLCHKGISVAEKMGHSFLNHSFCRLPEEELKTSNTGIYSEVPTRWVKMVPVKINILAWKINLDGLPTRLNLSSRGVEILSILCHICNEVVESSSHIFFSCSFARQVLANLCRWWELDYSPMNSYSEWLSWVSNIRLSKSKKEILEGICYVTWWLIWLFRNQCVFGSSQPRRDLIFDNIVQMSFYGFLIVVNPR